MMLRNYSIRQYIRGTWNDAVRYIMDCGLLTGHSVIAYLCHLAGYQHYYCMLLYRTVRAPVYAATEQ